MPKKSPLRLRNKTTTLVLDPTSARPWVGEWASAGRGSFLWRAAARATGPGAVNFWPALLKHKRTLPPMRILVFTGPGSFSATRAAVNIANALGYAWDVPVVGVHGPASSKQLTELLRELDQTKIAPHFNVKRRALPYYPKPVQLGRRKK